ncbi:aminotransferase class I and II [Caldalkalibacillus thermarum TA2.A1]|uniref:Aminotransferase class I and II n=1 Tax=Caldalkalibacillus thermarum (strain TA2.A1) TaxID=986075 RepID=F5L3K6_CALTT|nr:pyridoxal phosphate-dependent aminotransferase [Caldalkalibacillus thermarum]EGL84082.1 aminotransferase class I and II [Caldalkalibacillus thermarum TA2.A1]QZT33447.1 pyridoxal phosphate-dependent aminotransferase [Caldalkalibacillus thermarum TA2.A1]
MHFEPSQTLKNLPEQFFAKLTQKAARYVQQGYDVINLGQGNPDLPTPPHIVAALKKAAENPLYHRYSPFKGHPFLKEAVAQFYEREYHVHLDPETEVAILLGGKAGLVEVSQCLLNPGDVAFVPDPGYPDYWSGIALAGGEMVLMPLTAERCFLPDFSQLSPLHLKKAKLMFLNYPNNPTAAVAVQSLFEEAVALACQHQICVVHDFAYGAIAYDGHQPLSFLQIPGAKEVGIEIYTLSKTYNMAGWRIAFAVGNQSVIEAIELIQDHYHCSLFGAIQEAAAVALLSSQECVDQLRETYQRRRDTFISALQDIGWDVQPPQGSFFAWLPVPDGFDSASFADLLLEESHIVVAPGIGFGPHGEGYVRAGLVSSEETLLKAAERIERLGLFTRMR